MWLSWHQAGNWDDGVVYGHVAELGADVYSICGGITAGVFEFALGDGECLQSKKRQGFSMSYVTRSKAAALGERVLEDVLYVARETVNAVGNV